MRKRITLGIATLFITLSTCHATNIEYLVPIKITADGLWKQDGNIYVQMNYNKDDEKCYISINELNKNIQDFCEDDVAKDWQWQVEILKNEQNGRMLLIADKIKNAIIKITPYTDKNRLENINSIDSDGISIHQLMYFQKQAEFIYNNKK